MSKPVEYSECFETTLTVKVEVSTHDPGRVKRLIQQKVHILLEEILNNEYKHGEAESAIGITWKKNF